MTAHYTALVGKSLGRYRIVELIGAGGMGQVYRARDEVLRRDVAVKVLPREVSTDSTRLRRFEQEAQATGALNHPNILAIYDFGEFEGAPYAVMELLEGRTLREELGRSALPVRRAVGYAAQVAQGLAAAHEKGIVHRDLKPENLFITVDGRVKILDFGIAKLLEPEGGGAGGATGAPTQTEAGAVMGTTGYMAPEQIRGEPVDQRADIFALGCVLYEMLAGRRAFAGPTPADTMSAVLTKEPDPLASMRGDVGADLERTVARCLAKSPAERFQSARDLAVDLERIAGTASGAPAAHRAQPARATTGSRRRMILYIVSAACVVAAAIGVAWTQGWRFGRANRVPVVAVIPSQNASADPAQTSYLGAAFGEDLVTRLGQVSSVRLLPWLTTKRFADPTGDFKKIGRELGADKLVVGTYRSDGERVKVTVAVVDARSGLQSWSEQYDENIEELLALQQSLATGVATHLGGSVTAAERRGLTEPASRSPEAYEYYLRGADFMNATDPQTIALAGPYFDKALELDPKLAAAWVGVGAVNMGRYFRGQAGDKELAIAERAFRRALELDPKRYAAITGLGSVLNERSDYVAILKLAKTIRLNANDPEALLAAGWLYTEGGLPERGIPLLDRTLELDPGSQAAAWWRVIACNWSGKHELAIENAKSFVRRFGEDPEVLTWLGMSYYARGLKGEARLCISRSLALFGEEQSNIYTSLYAYFLFRSLGETARADSLADRWIDILDTRAAAYPENIRVASYRAALMAVRGRPGADALMDSILMKKNSATELILASTTADRFKRALRVMDRTGHVDDWFLQNSGLVPLAFGELYPLIERLPEYRDYRSGLEARHRELLARY